MFYRRLSNREKIVLFLTIAILIISFAYNFIIGPLITRWKVLNTQIVSKKIKLEKVQRIIRDKNKIQRDFDAYSKYIKPSVSEDREIADLMSDIEKIARTNNILIINVKPQAVLSGNFYKEFGVNLEMEGSMEDITGFLYELSKPPFLLKAKKLELNVKSPGTRLKGLILITKVAII